LLIWRDHQNPDPIIPFADFEPIQLAGILVAP
jgi:hypothetical protein